MHCYNVTLKKCAMWYDPRVTITIIFKVSQMFVYINGLNRVKQKLILILFYVFQKHVGDNKKYYIFL